MISKGFKTPCCASQLRYVHPYNRSLSQSALKSRTPVQTMKDWFKTHPGPGCVSYELAQIWRYERAGGSTELTA